MIVKISPMSGRFWVSTTEVFAMYERGSLTQTNNFREMTADMKYLLDNTDILKWVKQYQ